jgi:hypothetical protein
VNKCPDWHMWFRPMRLARRSSMNPLRSANAVQEEAVN